MYIKSSLVEHPKVDFCYEDAGMKETLLVIENGEVTLDFYCRPHEAKQLAENILKAVEKLENRRKK